jgi:uncharacterized protein YraI
MKRFLILFVLIVVLFSSSAYAFSDVAALTVENGSEASVRVGSVIAPEMIMEPGADPVRGWAWYSSDSTIAHVQDDNSITALTQGVVSVTGEAIDGSGETVSFTLNVTPEIIATVKKGVNIRQEPNADSAKMGAAAQGDKLTVTHPFYTEKWHQIDFNGETCYVSANYCELSESAVPVSVPSAEPTKEPEKTVSYIGNKNTKKLHRISCSSVDDMKEKNKVEFASKETALNKGYQPCKRCKP